MAKEKITLMILLIILIATGLRIVGLGWGLPNQQHIHSYHPDEQTTLASLRQMDPSKLDFSHELKGFAEFYFYMVGISMWIASKFNFITLVRSEPFYFQHPEQWARMYLVGRLLSVLFGVMTVVLVYLCGKELFNEKVGMLSAFLLAVLPTHVVQSHYTTCNAIFTFFAVLCLWLAIKVVKEGGLKFYVLFGIFCGLAISVKYTGVLLMFLVVTAHLLNVNTEFNIKKILGSLVSKKLAISLVLSVVFVFVSSPYLLINMGKHWQHLSVFTHQVTGLEHLERYAKKPFYHPLRVYLYGMGPLMLAVSMIGIITAIIKRAKENALLLCWIIPFYLISMRAEHYASDSRFLPIMPFYVILAAEFMFLDFKNRKWLSVLLIGIVSITTLIYTIALDKRFLGAQVQAASSKWIEANISDDATIGLYEDARWYAPNIIFREYWQFKNKGNYEKKHNYKFIYRQNYAELISQKPDFIIIPYDVAGDTDLRRDAVLQKTLQSKEYKLLRVFEKRIDILGKKLKLETGDLLFNPIIYIFKREE